MYLEGILAFIIPSLPRIRMYCIGFVYCCCGSIDSGGGHCNLHSVDDAGIVTEYCGVSLRRK